MKIIYFLFLLLLAVPLAYTEYISPLQKQEPSDLSVRIVKDSEDTIQNPYSPPLQYRNIEEYKQLGYLKRNARIPLFGKQAHLRRDLWYYYTILDGIKIPITIKKRKCSIAPGCNSVSSGDIVHVEQEEWRVELYERDYPYF